MKRVERLQGRLRLQKGDPNKAFEAERAGLKALGQAGVPVPAVAQEGPDWLLMPDAGPTLAQILADPEREEADKRRAFAAAGKALGLLHWAGMVHGRPAVRDICWDGQTARFIDLERFSQGRRAGFWQAADVVIFAQTWFTLSPEDASWLEVAIEAYSVNSPPTAMSKVRRMAFWLTPLGWLAGALRHLRPQSRELRAVGLTLSHLRGLFGRAQDLGGAG